MSSTPLIYRRSSAKAKAQGTLVSLHGLGGDIAQLEPLQRRLDLPLDRVDAQAWQARNPRQYAPSEHLGYLWWFDHRPGRPEPATFGDAIWAVEQFLYDLMAEKDLARPIFLLGYGQGATLALTMAAVLPDLLGGVVAIGGCTPSIPGWEPAARDLAGLPVLITHDPADPEFNLERVQGDAADLERLGARVELRAVDGSGGDPLAAAGLLDGWFAARLGHPVS